MVKVDWFAFTISHSYLESCLEWAKRFDYQELQGGSFGYHHGAVFAGTGRIYWGGNRDTVHVSLSGSALEYLSLVEYDWLRLIQLSLLWGGKCTRLDLAFDDRASHQSGIKYLDGEELVGLLKSRGYVGHIEPWSEYNGLGKNLGQTVYLGRPDGETRVRVYNKGLEQCEEGHWWRVELQLRKDRANAFILSVRDLTEWFCVSPSQEDLSSHLSGVLVGVLDFREGDDSNVSRRDRLVWWQMFLNCCQAVRLSKGEVIERSVDKLRAWLAIQVGPTLALLNDIDGGLQYVQAILSSGRNRFNTRHRALLAGAGVIDVTWKE